MKIRTILLSSSALAALLLSQSAWAYYCSGPQGSGYINIGDSMAQVQQACGAPTAQHNEKAPGTSNVTTTQIWTYMSYTTTEPLTTSTGLGRPNVQVDEGDGPNMVVTIQGGKVTNIAESGQNTQSTNQCGRPVSVGSSQAQVLQACGQPTNMNTQQQTSQGPASEVTVWEYNYGQYRQPLILEFNSRGQLSKIGSQ